MARTPEQQATLDAMRAAKAQAPTPEFTTSPGAAPTAPPTPEPAAPRGARAPRPVNPPMGTMYGTAQGVATDLGAAEAAQRYAQPQATPKVPPMGARDPYGAGAWQAERAAQEARSAAAPAQQAAGSWTERLNARTAAINEASAARTASTEAAAARVNGFTKAVGDARAANNTALKSVLTSPTMRGIGLAGGAYGALTDGLAANEAAGQGDYATAASHAGTGIASAAMMSRNPAAMAAGGAYLAGHAVGDLVVNPILDRTESGRAFKDTLGSGLNKVANIFGGGVDADRYAAVERFNRGEGPHPGAEGARQAAPVAPAAAAPAAQGSNFSPEHQALMKERFGTPQQAAAPDPAGNITKTVGKDGLVTYSGSNVKFGAGITDPKGAALDAASGMRSGARAGFGVSSLDTSEGYRQDLLELQRNAAERAAAPSGAGGGLSGFNAGGDGGVGSTSHRDAWNARMQQESDLRELMRNGLSARQAAGVMSQRQQTQQQATAAQMQHAAAMAGNATQRENNAATTRATMRGQDMQLMGHKMTNQIALANRQYEMFKDQRNYELEVKKFGQTQADANFEQGQQAVKDLHTEIGNMLPPVVVDGKPVPDLQNAARYATGLQALVGRMGKTMKDVSSTDKARFLAGMQLTDVANATATNFLTPWGTKAIQSNEPISAIRKLDNGDYQTNRKGVNGEVEIIPGRYVEKEGSFAGIGGRATNRFAPLIEQQRATR